MGIFDKFLEQLSATDIISMYKNGYFKDGDTLRGALNNINKKFAKDGVLLNNEDLDIYNNLLRKVNILGKHSLIFQ